MDREELLPKSIGWISETLALFASKIIGLGNKSNLTIDDLFPLGEELGAKNCLTSFENSKKLYSGTLTRKTYYFVEQFDLGETLLELGSISVVLQSWDSSLYTLHSSRLHILAEN